MIGSTRGYFFDYLTRLGSAWIGWGRWFNRESCQKRWSECDNVFLRVRKRQLILYYAYTFHPHSLDPLTPPSSHCFPINSKAEINRDFTTSHFIGDGSSGAGRLSWLQKEERTYNTHQIYDVCGGWWNGKCFFFLLFAAPLQFLRPGIFSSDDFLLPLHECFDGQAYRMGFDLSLPNYLTSFFPLVSF